MLTPVGPGVWGDLAGGDSALNVLRHDGSPAPLPRHEERTDPAYEADDADDPEDDTSELEEAEAPHDHEDDARDEKAEADDVGWHGSLRVGEAPDGNIPRLGDHTKRAAADPARALSRWTTANRRNVTRALARWTTPDRAPWPRRRSAASS